MVGAIYQQLVNFKAMDLRGKSLAYSVDTHWNPTGPHGNLCCSTAFAALRISSEILYVLICVYTHTYTYILPFDIYSTY